MAVEVDYLDLLEKGVEHWNRWREEHPDSLPDLSRAYLFEADLSGANLSGINLSRACLIGANLKAANLSDANLQSIYANKVNLEAANLSEANLRQADLSEARLIQANLSSARAEGVNLSAANLTGACIENWQIDSSTDFSDTLCDYLYRTHPQKDRYPKSGSFDADMFVLFMHSYVSSAKEMMDVVSDNPDLADFFSHHPATATTTAPGLLWLDFTRRRWVLVAGISLGGLIVSIVIFVGIVIWPFAPSRQPATDSSPSDPDTAIKLTSLPCTEFPLPDLKNRQPSHVYSSGVEFYGQFEDGVPVDGRGTMIFINGDRYDGEFKSGQRNGCGTFTFANGRQYQGQFKADQFDGVGIWDLETGERYVGQFRANKCEGWGTFIFSDGTSKSGTWKDGTLVGDRLSCNRDVSSQPGQTL